jgi:hypothetical protein
MFSMKNTNFGSISQGIHVFPARSALVPGSPARLLENSLANTALLDFNELQIIKPAYKNTG